MDPAGDSVELVGILRETRGFPVPKKGQIPLREKGVAKATQNGDHNLVHVCFSLNYRRTTNVQQLTCKIDLSNSFYYLFFSFVLIELKPFVLKGKVLGEKF